MKRRFICFLLTLTMLFLCVPAGIFAENEGEPVTTEGQIEQPSEDITADGYEEGQVPTGQSEGEEAGDDQSQSGQSEDEITGDDQSQNDQSEDEITGDDQSQNDQSEDEITGDDQSQNDQSEDESTGDDQSQVDQSEDADTGDDQSQANQSEDEITGDNQSQVDQSEGEVIGNDQSQETQAEGEDTGDDQSQEDQPESEVVENSQSQVDQSEDEDNGNDQTTQDEPEEEPAEQETVEEKIFVISEDGKTLEGYNGEDEEVTVPEGIEKIGKKAFYENKTIKKVTLPDSVTTINNYAFAECSNLEEVVLGEDSKLKTIGMYAFKDDTKLDISFVTDEMSVISNAFDGIELTEQPVDEGTDSETENNADEKNVEAANSTVEPSKPVQKALTTDHNTVTASWSECEGATWYTVYYGTSSTFSKATPIDVGNVTSYTIKNVGYKKWIHVWVQAHNEAGDSEVSSRKAIQTPEITAPDTPVQVEPIVTGNSIAVTWKESLGATSYTVYYGTEADIETAETADAGNKTSYTITDLAYTTTYYFWVKASNSAGTSEPSEAATATTGGTPAPSKPVQKALAADHNTVTAFWSESTGATRYTLYYGTSSTFEKATPIDVGNVTSYTIKDVGYKKWIHVWVQAHNEAGDSEVSSRKAIQTPAITEPDAPVQLEPTVNENSITAAWEESLGATSYTVYYGTEADIETAESVNAGNKTSYTITDLEYSTTYYIWVKASNSAGASEASEAETATTEEAPVPKKPVQKALTTDHNTVTASWNESAGATWYTVYYGTSSTFSKATPIDVGNVTSYTIKDVGYKKWIHVWVQAHNEAGDSDVSSRKAIQTPEITAPDAPVQVEPTVSGNSITAAWEESSGATSYTVYYGTEADIETAETADAGNKTSYTITDLAYTTTYYFWVKASNSAGTSEPSEAATATTEGIPVPSKPVQKALAADHNTVTAFWSESTGATRYTVYFGTSSTFEKATPIDVGNVTSYTIKDVGYKKWIHVWVQAHNEAGDSEVSSRKAIQTPAITEPDAPVQLEPIVNENSITAAWEEALGATSYTVYYGTEADIETAETADAGNETSYTITDLAYTTTYYIWVKASNSAGTSEASEAETATTEGTPVPSKPVQKALTADHNTVTASWNESEGATRYTVYYGTSSTFEKATSIDVGNVTSYTIKDVGYKKWIHVWVQAHNEAGDSEVSSRKAIQTPAITVPDKPVQNALTTDHDTVTASWNECAGATSYTVYYGTSSTFEKATPIDVGNVTSYTIKNAGYKKWIHVWVKASNSAGDSEVSSRKAIQTPAITAPDAPIQAEPTVNGNSITAVWEEAPGATSYTVYYGTEDIATAESAVAENGTSYTIENLAYSTRYFIWIKASNSAGTSEASEVMEATTEEVSETVIDGVAYEILTAGATNTVAVAHYYGESASPVIPETIKLNGIDYTVTKIGASAFEGNTNIVSIELPNSITVIGEKAFKGCTALASMTTPAANN